MTTPLKGEALKARVAELRPASQASLAKACGYVNASGGAKIAAFTQALAIAHDLVDASVSGRKRAGPPLGFCVRTIPGGGNAGKLILPAGYLRLIGVEPGQYVDIEHVGDNLVLRPANAQATHPTLTNP